MMEKQFRLFCFTWCMISDNSFYFSTFHSFISIHQWYHFRQIWWITRIPITMLYFNYVICKHFWLCINSFTIFFSIVFLVIRCKLCKTKIIYSRYRSWSNTVAFNDVKFEYICTLVIQLIKFLFCLCNSYAFVCKYWQIMLKGKFSVATVQAYIGIHILVS